MIEETDIVNISGSTYLLIKPSHRRHLGITDEDFKFGTRWNMQTQDETGKHGNYISTWMKKEKIEPIYNLVESNAKSVSEHLENNKITPERISMIQGIVNFDLKKNPRKLNEIETTELIKTIIMTRGG